MNDDGNVNDNANSETSNGGVVSRSNLMFGSLSLSIRSNISFDGGINNGRGADGDANVNVNAADNISGTGDDGDNIGTSIDVDVAYDVGLFRSILAMRP